MSLVIRAAEPGDVRGLEQLCALLLREHQQRFPHCYPALPPDTAAAQYAAEWRQRLEAKDLTCLVWLAVDRAPVGFLAGEVWRRPVGQPTHVLFAEWLYVAPEARHQGIALALFRHLIAACRAHGLTHVECLTVVGDPQWQRRGWTATATRYMRPVEDLAHDIDRAAAGRDVGRGI